MKCYLVVVSTPDFDSAYRIFSVLNDRGLDLSHSDILKVEVIGKLHKNEQDKFNEMWEDAEEYLGRDTFNELFSHVRMIYLKFKLRSTIIKEFRDYVKPSENPKDFIENKLVPFSNAFKSILEMDYKSANNADEINNHFYWLLKIDNRDWVPAAILFLSKYENDSPRLLKFFKDLERLAMAMMILRYNINQRIERFRNLLIEIEDGKNLYIEKSSLQLTNEEKRLIVKQLDGDLYQMKKVRLPVLLKLDSLLSDDWIILTQVTAIVILVDLALLQNPNITKIWKAEFAHEEQVKKTILESRRTAIMDESKVKKHQEILHTTVEYFSDEYEEELYSLIEFKEALEKYCRKYTEIFELKVGFYMFDPIMFMDDQQKQDIISGKVHDIELGNGIILFEDMNDEDKEKAKTTLITSLTKGEIEVLVKERLIAIPYFSESFCTISTVSSEFAKVETIDALHISNMIAMLDWFIGFKEE
ncbi:type II toxin-antitoxin system SpoIISA family toxin [Radiobacillus sp. PE A8.2]|uniref:type II toxin-antitoxin system SpoIISA family toxin n=1 Tax=Radiobacillus sp. PE A8.2 TaxID=3380349 RepID=UPI003890EC7A